MEAVQMRAKNTKPEKTWDMAAVVFSGAIDEQAAKMREAEKKEKAFMASIDRTPKCRVPEQGFCNAHDCPTHHGEWHE